MNIIYSNDVLDILRNRKRLSNHLYRIWPLKIILLNILQDISEYVIEKHCAIEILIIYVI